jgi:hypothetical protein
VPVSQQDRGPLRYVFVQIQAVNQGGHAFASSLEIHSTLSLTHTPATVQRLITANSFLAVDLRFGPIRNDIDYTWTGTCGLNLRPLDGAEDELVILRTDFRGRIWPDNLTLELLDTPP